MKMESLVALLVFLVITAPSHAGTAGLPLHESPRVLPDLAFFNGDGAPVTFKAWRGKVILLNIWATWCAPCRKEMPTLDRLQRELGGDRFEVVALSIDRAGPGVVRKFFDEIGIKHLRLFIAESRVVMRGLKVAGLPTTILAGPEGRELGRFIGPAEWDTPEMLAFFRKIIRNNK